MGDCLWYLAMIDRICVLIKDDCATLPGLSYEVNPVIHENVHYGRGVLKAVTAASAVIDPFNNIVAQSDITIIAIYLEQIASLFGLSLGECGDAVLAKLESRKERGVIHGNGDDR